MAARKDALFLMLGSPFSTRLAGSTVENEMRDTTSQAIAIQVGIHRRLSGAERLQLALEMSIMTRQLSIARLRREHPDWSDSDLKRELLRYAFGTTPLPPPLR